MIDLTVSIVLYNSNAGTINNILSAFDGSKLIIHIYLIDNSRTDIIKDKLISGSKIFYVKTSENLGFGKAHNISLKKSFQNSKYHLVLNPDVNFDLKAVEELFQVMEREQHIGIISPKILYPDQTLQYSCRLLPKFTDLLARRSNFLEKLFRYDYSKDELRFTNYDKIMEVPFLLGCFLFIRTSVFKTSDFFDERFFMYLEDLDLCRRVGKNHAIVFYPGACIFHEYERGSSKKFKLLKYHVTSMFKYFFKWGFFDQERALINEKSLRQFNLK